MSKSSLARGKTRLTLSEKQKAKQRRQQQQQTQLVILAGLAIVVLVVIVAAVLTNHSTVSANPSRYANLPSGTTQTGPASNGTSAYPASFAYLGNPNAPVKIEEIGSFSCPICMAYHQQVFVPLLLDEIKSGRLQFIFLPTTETGDYDAAPGTKAAYCAMQQGKFWPMYDLLYDGQYRLGAGAAQLSNIESFASQAGVDSSQFNNCYTSPDAAQYVTTANNFANQRGMLGTPTLFVFVDGRQIQPEQQTPNLTPGSIPWNPAQTDWRQMIESAPPA
ncbi:MAG: DsbA family protein [Aggregatilineales bacterium]